jgi:hypothetical protein
MLSTKELTLTGNRHLQLIFQFLSSFFQVIVTVKNKICFLDIVIDTNRVKLHNIRRGLSLIPLKETNNLDQYQTRRLCTNKV